MHQNAAGQNIGVVGIPINVGTASTFFGPVISAVIPGQASSATVVVKSLDIAQLLSEGGSLKNFWTYEDSLTTPPCSEGLRWWVSGKTMTVSQAQMDALLGVSDFSARGTQKITAQAVGL